MHYYLLPFVTAVYFILFGIYSLKKSRGNQVSATFFLVCLTTFFWQGVSAVLYKFGDLNNVTFIIKFGYSFIIFLPTTVYHFLTVLSEKKQEYKWVTASYAISFMLLVVNIFSPLFISGHYDYYWTLYPKFGVLHPLHVIQTVVVILRGIYCVYERYTQSKGDSRNRYLYAILGMTIFLFSAIDYLTNYGFEFYPPGICFILMSLTIIGYSFIKYELMDIKVALGKTAATLVNILIYGFLLFVVEMVISSSELVVDIVAKIIYFSFFLFVGLFFEKTRRLIQTPLEKKFLKGYYNLEQIVSDISTSLIQDQSIMSVFQTISQKLSDEMETSQSYFIVQDDVKSPFKLYKNTTSTPFHTFKNDSLFVDYFKTRSTPIEFQKLPVSDQKSVERLPITPPSLIFSIRSENAFFGIFILGHKLSGDSFTESDINLIKMVRNQLRIVFERNHYHQELIQMNKLKDIRINYQEKEIEEKKKMEQDLQLAQKVQQRILPSRVPNINNYHIETYFRPLKVVSGDFYYFLRFSPTKIGVVLADVVGKGISAGFTTISFRNMIDKHIQADISPKECMGVLNNIIYDSDIFDKYIPIFYGVLDTESNTLAYANAGHDPGLLYSNGEFSELSATGLQAGAMKDEVYEEHCVTLNSTDTLLLYTDGLTDILNSDKVSFGIEGIQETLQRYYRLGGDESFSALLQSDIKQYLQSGGKYKDDIAVIFIEHIQEEYFGGIS